MTDELTMECPVCRQRTWARDVTAGRILALTESYAVLACTNCGQRRLDPQLTASEVDELYSSSYFGPGDTSAKSLLGIKEAPEEYAVTSRERHAKFERTLEKVRALCPSAKQVLDVGAATGDFVRIALEHGFAAEGIETSQYAIQKALETNAVALQRVSLADISGSARYDCIHLNHVFEHFNSPVQELLHIRRLLRPRGVLYIEVPYQFQLIERLQFWLRTRNPEFTLHSLHHAFFYTPTTISRMLGLNGFETVEISVFDRHRYPATGIAAKAKKLLWLVLAWLLIGNYIELYARRNP